MPTLAEAIAAIDPEHLEPINVNDLASRPGPSRLDPLVEARVVALWESICKSVDHRTYFERPDCEDFTQEAFVVLLEKAAELEAGGVNGWLRKTAYFIAMNEHRKRTRRRNFSLDAMMELESGEEGDSPPALHSYVTPQRVIEARQELFELLMAGVPEKKPSHWWNPKRIVEALKSWADREGRPPRAGEFDDPALPTFYAIRKHYGSLNAALEAASLPVRAKIGTA